MAIRSVPLSRPTAEVGLSFARLPGWLVWGTMIGLIQIFAIATVGPLGVSTAYPQVVGFVGDGVFPGFAQQPYLQLIGASIGWEVMLVFGLLVGALIASFFARRNGGVAPVCVAGFDQGRTRGYLRAFVGGFLFIFGARLAGGCTSGHLLSGTSQMAISGLVFGLAVFVSGYLVARFFFHEPTTTRG